MSRMVISFLGLPVEQQLAYAVKTRTGAAAEIEITRVGNIATTVVYHSSASRSPRQANQEGLP